MFTFLSKKNLEVKIIHLLNTKIEIFKKELTKLHSRNQIKKEKKYINKKKIKDVKNK